MTTKRSLSVAGLLLLQVWAHADVVEFPKLDDGGLRRVFLEAETWSVFRDGVDPKNPERYTANQRFRRVPGEMAFWFQSVGWDPPYWSPTFGWIKRASDEKDVQETVTRLLATGFAKVPPSDEKAPYRIGVEAVSKGNTYRWVWPVRSGSDAPDRLRSLSNFMNTLGVAPGQPGSSWIYKAQGSLTLTTDCQSFEPEGNFEATLENRGKEPVNVRAILAGPIERAPFPISGTGFGSQPFTLQPGEKQKLTLKLDLTQSPKLHDPKRPSFWFAIPDPVTGVGIDGPAALIGSGCPLPKTKSVEGKTVLDVPARAEALDAKLAGLLDVDERSAVAKSHPQAKVLARCEAKLSGNERKESVLVVAKPDGKPDRSGRYPVERVALIRENGAVVARTLEIGPRPGWEYRFNGKRFSGNFECGVKPGKHKDILDPGKIEKLNPKKEKLVGETVCFATSDVYNNWDCFLYHPKKKAFVLWFSQAFAD